MVGLETPRSAEELPTDGLIFTPEQLLEYSGQDENAPLYVAVRGRVYDVSAGRRFYGPGGQYHGFAGKDGTVEFGTGCRSERCFQPSLTAEGLSHYERREADRWVDFFEKHDKYTFVGTVAAARVDAVLEKEMRLQEEEALNLEGGDRGPAINPALAGPLKENAESPGIIGQGAPLDNAAAASVQDKEL
eukprot:g10066.t1